MNTEIKKKILFIHHGGSQGGAFRSLVTIIDNLDKDKYYPKVLLLSRSNAGKLLKEHNIDFCFADDCIYRKFRFYFIHSEVGPVKWYKFINYVKVFCYLLLSAKIYAPRLLRKEAPDLVHINSSVLSDWVIAAKKTKIKNVIHIREPLAKGHVGVRRNIFRLLIRYNSDSIIAISHDNAHRVNIPEKTTVIYDPVNIGQSLVNIGGYMNKSVLYAGGTDLHKGFITLANAIEFIDKSITIFFAGIVSFPKKRIWQPSRKQNEYKKKMFEKIKNYENVKIIGFSDSIEDLLNHCTVSISPFSVPHCSMLVLESYALKKPAIGSNVQGMDEIIEHEKSGLLFEKNNPVALAKAINEICLDSFKARRMGEYGYEKFQTEFDKGDEKLVKLYNRLLKDQ